MNNLFAARCRILQIFFVVVFGIFAIRLFQLQILNYEEYEAEARAQHEKRSILPARRGKILIRKNRLTEDTTPLATNTTLKKLFVDPLILKYPHWDPNKSNEQQEQGNPAQAAQLLAPLLVNAHVSQLMVVQLPERKMIKIKQWSMLMLNN